MIATSIVLLSIPCLVAAAPEPVEKDFILHPVEVQIVERTNAERARYGLPPLEIDFELIDSARRHCIWMARAHSLQHTSAPVAENIAMGQRTPTEALRSWMNSSGHRANILGGYRRLGVAAYVSSSGTIYWCQQFTQ